MTERRRLLVTGARGQVGRELCRSLGPLGEVYGAARGATFPAFDAVDLDITCGVAINRVLAELRPHYVINAAAYTAVDGAENAPDEAALVNTQAVRHLVEACEQYQCCLIHYSTDYVFDGATTQPYAEQASVAPLSVYGRTKRAGELAVLASAIPHWVLRTGWVYAAHGHNFVRTMQRLGHDDGVIRVVADQFGTPTWARSLAELTSLLLSNVIRAGSQGLPNRHGLYHVCSPDHTTWYDLACAVVEAVYGPERAAQVVPITTQEYPLPAPRPAWSVMDPTALIKDYGLCLPPWRVQLAQMLADQDL